MEAFFTSQEILVVINTKFAAEEYQPKEEEKGLPRPHIEKLADACWNGILSEKLPEISITVNRRPLPIWEVGEGQHLLYMKLGEMDAAPEAEYTINPYRFAATHNLN